MIGLVGGAVAHQILSSYLTKKTITAIQHKVHEVIIYHSPWWLCSLLYGLVKYRVIDNSFRLFLIYNPAVEVHLTLQTLIFTSTSQTRLFEKLFYTMKTSSVVAQEEELV